MSFEKEDKWVKGFLKSYLVYSNKKRKEVWGLSMYRDENSMRLYGGYVDDATRYANTKPEFPQTVTKLKKGQSKRKYEYVVEPVYSYHYSTRRTTLYRFFKVGGKKILGSYTGYEKYRKHYISGYKKRRISVGYEQKVLSSVQHKFSAFNFYYLVHYFISDSKRVDEWIEIEGSALGFGEAEGGKIYHTPHEVAGNLPAYLRQLKSKVDRLPNKNRRDYKFHKKILDVIYFFQIESAKL
jgi:hypothetical protein